MAKTGVLHHVGTFLLFAASILLLITTISAPVINDISMLRVTNSGENPASVTFGTFGYCSHNAGGSGEESCSGRHIGYLPSAIISTETDDSLVGTASSKTADGLTNVMVLHPICCGLAFIAFLLSLGSGIIGALFATLVSAITFVLTLVVMATDFTAFGIIRKHVNGEDNGMSASFGVAMWTVLAAMILLFFATFIVLFTCFSARRHKRDHKTSKMESGYASNGMTTHKRRFWQRRSRH